MKGVFYFTFSLNYFEDNGKTDPRFLQWRPDRITELRYGTAGVCPARPLAIVLSKVPSGCHERK